MTAIKMPQLGETVVEGTILKWAKQVGDTIAEDEVLVEISTDKVDTEVPSPVAGTILEILVPEGETVEVGVQLVVIGEPGETAGSGTADAPAPAETAPVEAAETAVDEVESPDIPQEVASELHPARDVEPEIGVFGDEPVGLLADLAFGRRGPGP